MAGSVGLVETKYYTYEGEITLESGRSFGPITVAYETYGELNKEKSNAILVCHALSGDAHAAGRHPDGKTGWWDDFIGPGKTFDTDRYHVICSNVLGGCKGTTGPASTNPATGEPYGLDFPVVTVKDMVRVQKKLVEHLGVDKLLAVVGGSMGGMQALQWAVSYPDGLRFCIPIASTARSSPQQIGINEVKRRAITSDPRWNQGKYYGGEPPRDGLALARMLGHITFLSEESMHQKFGRRLQDKDKLGFDLGVDFEVESYLRYKGDNFVDRFDANSYLYLTRAIDYFDLTDGGEKSLREAFESVKAKFLVVAISSDWLYPPYQSKEIVRALRANDVDVTYAEINSSYGHDAFLLEPGQTKHLVTAFLSQVVAKDLLQKPPVIGPDTSIKKASRLMIETGYTHLPIVEEGRLTGIITAWDIARAVSEDLTRLEDIMTTEVITAKPGESLTSITGKIRRHGISALPVVDREYRVLGLVTSDTISQLVGDKQPAPGVREP